MTPPRTGPTAVEIPTVAPNIPKARPRSGPRKRSWMRPVFCGVSSPAAAPWRSRAATSTAMWCAAPARALVTAKALMAMRNIRRRPTASPSRPPATRVRPKVRAYPETTHWTSAGEAANPRWMEGRATLTMLTSSSPMKPAPRVMPSARQRRGSGSSVPPVRLGSGRTLRNYPGRGRAYPGAGRPRPAVVRSDPGAAGAGRPVAGGRGETGRRPAPAPPCGSVGPAGPPVAPRAGVHWTVRTIG